MLAAMTVKESTLNWLQTQVADPLIDKTFKPETISFFSHINRLWEIPWGLMLIQIILITGIGACSYAATVALDQKPVGNMILLTTIVCCLSSIVQCVSSVAK